MPSLNYGKYLEQALGSIWRQSVKVHEVIIVDGGSTDNTLDIVNQQINLGRPINLIKAQKNSPAIARNLAIQESTGNLIAFLDADDLWPNGKLERQLAYLNLHPQYQMVTGYISYFEMEDPDTLEPMHGSKTENIFHVHVGACVYKRNCFSFIGGAFDEELLFAEDVDLLLRLRESGLPFAILRSIELFYRLHPNSMMSDPHPRKASDFRLATYKSLKRRRLAGTIAEKIPDFVSYLAPENE